MALLFLGILTRFWNLGHPQGQYDIDQIAVYQHVENILNGKFSLLEEYGGRPPFDRFVVALVCKCLSGLSIGTVLRATNAFFDVAALSLFYWVGKSWGNRRTGLILMALGLISRPMLYKAYWGLDYNLLSILVPLSLSLTLWALQSPSLRRFMIWGLGVAFGLYVATPYRPWVPVLVIGTGWILWGRLKTWKASKWHGLGYVLGFTILWSYVFLISHNFIFPRSMLSSGANSSIFIVVLSGFMIWTIAWFWNRKSQPFQAPLGVWGVGALLALGLYGIIAVDPLFSPHVEILTLWKTKVFQADPWNIARLRLDYLWDFLALKGGDFQTISNPYQPFFDLATGLAVLFGLIRVLMRPTLGGLALCFFGCLGLSLFVISVIPHSGRAYACLFPFYALAAFSLEDLWNHFRQALPGKAAGLGGMAIVFVLGFGVLVSNFGDVWNWMDMGNTEFVMAQLAREAPPTSQIYLVPSPSLRTQAVDQLTKGRNMVWWKQSYAVPKPADLSNPEIRFLVPAENTQAQAAFKKLYPSAVWRGMGSRKGDPEIKVWEMVYRGPSLGKASSGKGQTP